MTRRFPADPVQGTIVEALPGVFYQFDQMLNTWVELIRSDPSSELATAVADGAMEAADLAKLNRMVVPPPKATLTAEGCEAVFGAGVLALRPLDNIVTVDGLSELVGPGMSPLSVPSRIHQHTYGIDFGLDLESLVDELTRRGQFNIKGLQGVKGKKGPKGERGDGQSLTGPPGDQGDRGDAPPCTVTAAREIYPAVAPPELNRVIVGLGLETDEADPSSYRIVAQRQQVGVPDSTAGLLRLQSDTSSWLVALASTSVQGQAVYYLDVDPIVDAIRQKFLDEVSLLKSGMEAIVLYWLQQMSDLFDQQKQALCCALEFCESRTANAATRQHIESVTAASVGSGKVTVSDRSAAGIEIPNGLDCGAAGIPDTAVNRATCVGCLFTTDGSPTVVTFTDAYGSVELARVPDQQAFYGCRLTPVPVAGGTEVMQVPTHFSLACVSDRVTLAVTYPTTGINNEDPTNRGGSVRCPTRPGPVPTIWGSTFTASDAADFGACSTTLGWTYTLDCPGLYGRGLVTVGVSTYNSGSDVGAAGVCDGCLFGTAGSPAALTLTDSKGTVTLSKFADKKLYQGCRMMPVSNGTTNCDGGAATSVFGSTSPSVMVPVLYTLSCSSSTQAQLKLSYPACAGGGTPTNQNYTLSCPLPGIYSDGLGSTNSEVVSSIAMESCNTGSLNFEVVSQTLYSGAVAVSIKPAAASPGSGGDAGSDPNATAGCPPATVTSLTLTDAAGSVTLAREGQQFTGCRMMPVWDDELRATVQTPVHFTVTCGPTAPGGDPVYQLQIGYPSKIFSADGNFDPVAGMTCQNWTTAPFFSDNGLDSPSPGQYWGRSFVAGGPVANPVNCTIYSPAPSDPPELLKSRAAIIIGRVYSPDGKTPEPPVRFVLTGPGAPSIPSAPESGSYPKATSGQCLFGPDDPPAPASLTVTDPRFGPVPLTRSWSVSLGRQVWSACRMVTVSGSEDYRSSTRVKQVQVPVRYDLFVAGSDGTGDYKLQVKYPCVLSGLQHGVPCTTSPNTPGPVTCAHMDGVARNVLVGTITVPFTGCVHPLTFNAGVDLPYLYGTANQITVSRAQAAPQAAAEDYREFGLSAGDQPVVVELPAGGWRVSLVGSDSAWDGEPVLPRVSYRDRASDRRLMLKFAGPSDATLEHGGGPVELSYPVRAGLATGRSTIRLRSLEARDDAGVVWIPSRELAWLARGIRSTVELEGQQFLIVGRGAVSVAWPTFDGATFAGLPDSGQLAFRPDPGLAGLVSSLTGKKFPEILFPVA